MRRRAPRWAIGLLATAVVLIPLGWMWFASLVPSPLSVTEMGTPEFGGGARHSMRASATDVSVAALVGPRSGTPQVQVELTARQQRFTLPGGQKVDGYTLNDASPGPTITATQGDLVQVTLRNDNVRAGVTLHWHGVDVPNAEDGVAGVTQDAVAPGHRFVYRFVAADAGTYWYHSHQVANPQVKGGLFGALVIRPRTGGNSAGTLATVHTYAAHRTVNGRPGDQRVTAKAGDRLRIRVINTDNGPMRTWASADDARVLAIDGHDLNQPGPLGRHYVLVPGGGRADVELTVPASGAVRLDLGGGTGIVAGPSGAAVASGAAPELPLDLMAYGRPAALPFDASRPDRSFEYRIGRRIGFMDGTPGFWWTINGKKYPDVPMFVVDQGDIVQMRISNTGLLGADTHPIHLHGHHAVVLSHNGVKATGSPWWVDSLNVTKGETYVIAFVAGNPGIWMDHCHNLDHAEDGMIAHLMYTGVSEPYRLGTAKDGVTNTPE